MGRRKIYQDNREKTREWARRKARERQEQTMAELIADVRGHRYMRAEKLARELAGRYKISAVDSKRKGASKD